MYMDRPTLYGGKVPCALYLELEVFDIIEAKRGKKSRNSYLNELIENSVKKQELFKLPSPCANTEKFRQSKQSVEHMFYNDSIVVLQYFVKGYINTFTKYCF